MNLTQRSGAPSNCAYTSRVLHFLAFIVGACASYLPQLIFGDHLSLLADFLLGTVTGAAGYWFTLRKLRDLRG
jgi:hypothetical protein